MSRPERMKDYKKGIDADEARRKREDNIIQMRKTIKEENLKKKRAPYELTVQDTIAMSDSTRQPGGAQNAKVVYAYAPFKRADPHLVVLALLFSFAHIPLAMCA